LEGLDVDLEDGIDVDLKEVKYEGGRGLACVVAGWEPGTDCCECGDGQS